MLDALFKRGPLFLLIAAACVACGGGAPADPPASIAVECRNLAYEFDDDGEFHDLPIAVGDQVACSISLRHVRSDEGRADTPPRIFSQAEWAFVSNDGGALYHSPAKPIRGWFGGGLPNILPEEDDSRRVNTCRGPNSARNVFPVELAQCDSVCCETEVGGRPRYDLVSRSTCDARGSQRPLSVCLPDDTAGCCRFQNQAGAAFIEGYEVTSRALCEAKETRGFAPTWDDSMSACACCKFGGVLGPVDQQPFDLATRPPVSSGLSSCCRQVGTRRIRIFGSIWATCPRRGSLPDVSSPGLTGPLRALGAGKPSFGERRRGSARPVVVERPPGRR